MAADGPGGSDSIKARDRNYIQIGAVLLLIVGCLYVLRPFMAAVLFGGAIVISSWPLYLRLLPRMGNRRTLAAATLTLTLTLLVIVPIALVAYNLADDISRFYAQIKVAVDSGHMDPPAWLRQIPMVGESIDKYLRDMMSSREQMMETAKRMMEPARHYLLAGGILLGTGVAQMSLAVFVSFFLYRDGERILQGLNTGMRQVIGPDAPKVAGIVSQTVRGVMYGLLGTALAQALVAALGFAIAGVPAVPLLGFATFIMSLVPIGPPIIWGGAAFWLFNQGQMAWGVFMLVWGVVLISGVDNIVKPMLISRGSSLPFILVLLGVLGGVLAFGFVGLFIGPTLLAVGYSLLREWTGMKPAIVTKT